MSQPSEPDAIMCLKCEQLEKRVASLNARFNLMGRCPAKTPSMPSGVTCIHPIGHEGSHEQVRDGVPMGW